MSDATAVVRTRVPVRHLQLAEKILHKLGLPPADAVNMVLAQIEIRQGLPFEVSTKSRPLFTSDEQAAAWTEALGANCATARRGLICGPGQGGEKPPGFCPRVSPAR